MLALHRSARFCEVVVRSSLSAATLALGVGVTLAWLAIFGASALAMSAMAPPAARLAIETGHLAHLNAPPLTEWPIPVGRLQFDAYQLALDADDEIALAKITAVA